MAVRVLFACWPFEGHVFPQLSVAAAMRDRGHDVAFFTGERAREAIESEGLALHAFDRTEGAWAAVHEREEAVGGRRQSLRVQHQAFREWLVESIPDQVVDLDGLMQRWRPDVIVADAAMWGAILVLHEAAPIPVALASPLIFALIPGPEAPVAGSRMAAPRTARAKALRWAVTAATDVAATGLRRRLDQIRANHGLGPLGCSVNAYCGRLPLYLVASVPELDLNRRDLPPSVRYVGPLLWHPREPPGTIEWLEQIPANRPWVHVTEGTSHFQEPFLLRSAAEGYAEAPFEAILTTGSRRDPDRLGLGARAANVHVTRWLSHDALLPRCSVLVTTGGPGTIMAGLRTGVPLVVVPTTWDKPDNARRIVDAGVGVMVPPKRCTPRTLREATDRILADPEYKANAERIARLLAAAPGPAGAAEHVEAIARDGAQPGSVAALASASGIERA